MKLCYGENKGKTISVEDIAQKLNTIIDVIIHLTDKARVTKLFLKDSKPWKIKNMLGEYYCANKDIKAKFSEIIIPLPSLTVMARRNDLVRNNNRDLLQNGD